MPLIVFEEVNLIAQHGGHLEIQAGGGFAHFFLQAGNGGGHIGRIITIPGHQRAEFILGLLQLIIRGVEAQGALVASAHALRGDAVGLGVLFPDF